MQCKLRSRSAFQYPLVPLHSRMYHQGICKRDAYLYFRAEKLLNLRKSQTWDWGNGKLAFNLGNH